MENSLELLEWLKAHSSGELGYVFLIVILFVLPRLLLKFAIPMALTSFALGTIANYVFNFYDGDNVIPIFSTLGVISLFLFAGLEVDLSTLKKNLRPIIEHVIFRSLVVALLAFVFSHLHALVFPVAVVLALALATPSTGFILDSIETSKISNNHKFWIKLKAISAELVALAALLVFSQMGSIVNITGSFIIIGTLILILPVLIKKLATYLEKLTPGSEFGFILMLAIISGIITKKLGAYYLVGAFLVGMAAGQYKRQSPSTSEDQILHSLRSFSAFFMPFYFFNSGLKLPQSAFSMDALNIAIMLFIISVPLKLGTIIIHRRLTQQEQWKDSLAIGVSLMPNLVFGLVLADILKNKMNISIDLYAGIILYTLSITLLAPFIVKFIPNSDKLNLNAIGADPMNYDISISKHP